MADTTKTSDAVNGRLNNSVLGRGCRIKGEVHFEPGTRVEATIEGTVTSEGLLIIGAEANVRAEVSGDEVVVLGEVTGNITCTQRLELGGVARVKGKITSPRIVIHDGVRFEGDCKMPEGSARSAEKDNVAAFAKRANA